VQRIPGNKPDPAAFVPIRQINFCFQIGLSSVCFHGSMASRNDRN
jgi:hypothetical protein